MASNSKNIFQQFLIEEFEKQKGKKMDVVTTKRQYFKTLLAQAENELQSKAFAAAAQNYYAVVQYLKTEPYPDELELSLDMDYSIKCCFCYSVLKHPDLLKNEEMSSVLLDIMNELNKKFVTKLFPMFLLILLNFHRNNWLATLTRCSEIVDSEYDEEKDTVVDVKNLLPTPADIRCEIGHYEELAFYGYGKQLSRNAMFKSRFDKYSFWLCTVESFVLNKVRQQEQLMSKMDLHALFHREIFPVWCLDSGEDHKKYYSEEFVTSCKECMHAKLYNGIPRKDELTEDQAKFESYVTQCAEIYKKYAGDACFEVKKIKGASPMKQTATKSSQTEKNKANKQTQTEGSKTKHTEVQVNGDSEVLNVMLEIKNKCLTIQEKKDDTIAQLNKKMSKLQDKINKDLAERNFTEHTLKKNAHDFNQLRGQYEKSIQKYKAEQERNILLQKLLMRNMNDKFNLHTLHYKNSERQAQFMVTYLKDILTVLLQKNISSNGICEQHIAAWEIQLRTVKSGLEQLNTFYQNVQTNMMKIDIYNTIWPEILEAHRFEDNIIFQNFKAAIINSSPPEEMLCYQYTGDSQEPMFYLPQYLPQDAMLLAPQQMYSNTPGLPMQFQSQVPQVQQIPKKENVPPDSVTTPIAVNKQWKPMAEQNLRMCKSTEFLNKTGGGQTSSVQGCSWDTSIRSSCPPKNVWRQKEDETILLDYVMQCCPGATEEKVALALLNLMEKNKGTLLNLSKEKIVNDVKLILLKTKKEDVWVTPKSPLVSWHNDHTENECSICFEEYSPRDKYTLPCQHVYHKQCIKRWLRTSSICPICRVHSVIDEEFPPLH